MRRRDVRYQGNNASKHTAAKHETSTHLKADGLHVCEHGRHDLLGFDRQGQRVDIGWGRRLRVGLVRLRAPGTNGMAMVARRTCKQQAALV
jgi:hypothetical protein